MKDKKEEDFEKKSIAKKAYIDDNELVPGNINRVNLSDDEGNEMAVDLIADIKKSEGKMSGLIADIEEYNKMYDGKPEKEVLNWPFKKSPNYRSPYATYITKGIKNRAFRTLFGIEPYCLIKPPVDNMPNTDSTAVIEETNEQQDYIHYIAKHVMKVESFFRKLFKPATLEPVVIAKLGIKREWERVSDYEFYTSVADFKKEYPSAEKAKIAEGEYDKYIQKIQKVEKEGKKEGVKIPIEKDEETYFGPEAVIVERKDFITVPSNSTSLDKARIQARKIEKSGAALLAGQAQKKYINIDELKKKFEANEKNKDKRFAKEIFKGYECLMKEDRNQDGMPEKYIVMLIKEPSMLIRIEKWSKNLFFIPFQIEAKVNKIDGTGTGQMLEKITEDNDAWHNIRQCAGILTVAPSMKAKAGDEYLESGGYEQNHEPGVWYWMADTANLEPMQIISNFAEGYKEEEMNDRNAELIGGFTAGGAGMASQLDPKAPASKHISMIQEMNINIDEYIGSLRDSLTIFFWAIGEICHQYMPDKIDYFAEQDGRRINKQIDKDKLKLKQMDYVMNAISIMENKHIKTQENRDDIGFLMQFPIVQTNEESQWFMLNKYLVEKNFEGRKKVLPTLEQLREKQIAIQMEAMKRMQIEAEIRRISGEMVKQGAEEKDIQFAASKIREEAGIPQEGQEPAERRE